MRRAVVTGLGAASPFGLGVKRFWDGLAAGTCAIGPLTRIAPAGLRCTVAAEFPDVPPGSARRSRADRLALAAAREALEDAQLAPGERPGAGLVVGAVGGGMLEAEAWYWARAAGEEGGGFGPLRTMLPGAHAEAIARALGVRGPRETIVTACSSGAAALAVGADLIADGAADVVLAGGADAITRICFLGFDALRLLDPAPCRPFDRTRRGMSIGEGAAFVVLEEAGRARDRGARVRAEFAGYGMTTDAHHVTAPHPEGDGMVRAMRTALEMAGIGPGAVSYVNAHGTATSQNDRVEARALREVFGGVDLLVSATKSMIGHTMAAAGALEAVATVLALEHGLVPPTAGLTEIEPEMAFDCVPRVARAARLEHALSNSFGFGGQNLTLVLRRPGA